VTKKAKEEKDSLAIEQSKRIAELEAQIAELTETLKRVQAEFINYKNRTEKETRQLIEYANGDFIRKILPVLDSFELALKSTSEPEKFRKGIEMVYAQLLDVLRQEGLMPIDSQGKKFDPYLHEVLLKEKSDKGRRHSP
jgi:molecular chaperone GrpE